MDFIVPDFCFYTILLVTTRTDARITKIAAIGREVQRKGHAAFFNRKNSARVGESFAVSINGFYKRPSPGGHSVQETTLRLTQLVVCGHFSAISFGDSFSDDTLSSDL